MIVQNRFTFGVNVISHFGKGKILTANESGIICLWQYHRPISLMPIRNYYPGGRRICCIIPFTENKFISVNESTEIRVWEISSETCSMILQGGSVQNIDSAVLLPNNLLVISGYRFPVWGCFDVWDLESGVCIYEQQQYCHRPKGMTLATTAQGFLVSAGLCGGEAYVWQIDRSECKVISKTEIYRIYSMAMLPTGELVTGDHNLVFYKISYDKGINIHRTFVNTNVIDAIFPIGGYKLLVIDRSYACAGTMKLWDCLSRRYEIIGNSRLDVTAHIFGSVQFEVSHSHILLERESAILSLGVNKIVIHEFSEGIFHFPKEIAEIRKNSRILSQAHRTGTSFFANLPEEIIFKIIALTSENTKQCDKRLCQEIAENYFCRPSAAISNHNSKEIIDGEASGNIPSENRPKI